MCTAMHDYFLPLCGGTAYLCTDRNKRPRNGGPQRNRIIRNTKNLNHPFNRYEH